MGTLYLKYRPKQFEEILGQDHVKLLLSNAVKSGKVSHSYLFSGPRGTGKTSVARILAKSVNCDHPVDGYDPCNSCDSCVEIDTGRTLDVIEMDAASNRGIDEIRSIRDRVFYMPSKLKYKVYIIDEVHMLTREAFNALLKTLEEPPEKTIFILATTEIQKVPETIISRCQVLEFRRISPNIIRSKLEDVCKAEKIEYEIVALDHISKEAAGGMRDALSMLEGIARFSNEKVTLADTFSVLGDGPIETVESYITSILDGNVDALIHVVDSIKNQGTDVMNFLRSVVEYSSDRIKDDGLISIGKFAGDLIQILRYEEKQFDLFKVMSAFETLKYKKISSENVQPLTDQVRQVEKVDQEIKTDVERLIRFYAQKDLSVYVSLSEADLKDLGDRILVISYTLLQNEILKEKDKMITEDFKSVTSRDVRFVFAYSKVPIDSMNDKLREPIIKVLSLFGGKILPEGGE
ncbi:MAG: DNA polymerase III subunit gamma/tau [Thermotogae bacterium]|jgi:DNA polymerase-3 subunit gamma/tau|nr:DNA polymerase III subunit gamma/tau [Thermotogota bacterium]